MAKKPWTLAQHYSVNTILIEDTGNGSALIQALKHKGIPVIGRTCRDPKDLAARLRLVLFRVRAERVAGGGPVVGGPTKPSCSGSRAVDTMIRWTAPPNT